MYLAAALFYVAAFALACWLSAKWSPLVGVGGLLLVMGVTRWLVP